MGQCMGRGFPQPTSRGVHLPGSPLRTGRRLPRPLFGLAYDRPTYYFLLNFITYGYAARELYNRPNACLFYIAAKATYIRLLHGKIGLLGFFGPSSVKRGRTDPYSAWMKCVVCLHLYIP